jgi:flagellar hook-length control protein FliK
LELTIRNGHMTARMETETQSARNMLVDNLPALKERLAQQHITVERFDIEWQGQGQGGFSQRPDDQARWQAPRAGYATGTAAKAGGSADKDTATPVPRRPGPATSLDVVI